MSSRCTPPASGATTTRLESLRTRPTPMHGESPRLHAASTPPATSPQVSMYGCSIDAKIAYLAALSRQNPYEYAVIDSGGALVASLRVVPCGETVRAMQTRFPE